jgi:hypothetical protein
MLSIVNFENKTPACTPKLFGASFPGDCHAQNDCHGSEGKEMSATNKKKIWAAMFLRASSYFSFAITMILGFRHGIWIFILEVLITGVISCFAYSFGTKLLNDVRKAEGFEEVR